MLKISELERWLWDKKHPASMKRSDVSCEERVELHVFDVAVQFMHLFSRISEFSCEHSFIAFPSFLSHRFFHSDPLDLPELGVLRSSD